MKLFFVLLAICVLALRVTAYSQIPQKISYQGLLTTSSGTPVADGSYDLKFEIYNLPTGGSLRHTETQTGVSVQRGTFSILLGTATPLTLAFNESLYVQVTAVSGPTGPSYPFTFSPRSELSSAPYALAPWRTSGDSVYYNTGNVGIGTTSPSAPLTVSNASVGNGLVKFIAPSSYTDLDNPYGWIQLTNPNATTNNNAGIWWSDAENSVNQSVSIHGIFTDRTNHFGDFAIATRGPIGFAERLRVTGTGKVGIGTTAPQGALDVSSTTGAFVVPRMTTAQRDAFTAVNGMIIYNTTTNRFNFYENGAWVTK